MDLPQESGEQQLRNQEVFYGKWKQTDAEVSTRQITQIPHAPPR